jgi:hypothetical protein
MHLRRALLLFAIVLGLAALAAAVSRPSNVDDEPTPTPGAQSRSAPTVSPGPPGSTLREITFDVDAPRARRLGAGQAATVNVEVETAGMVSIPGLGVSAAAEPHTPARFDLLADDPGRYAIEFEPAAGDGARRAGTLVVATELRRTQ